MTPTERTASNPSRNRGLLATLRASVSVKGTRAPKTGAPKGPVALPAALATLLCLACLTPGAADAEIYHPFLSSFSGKETPAGKMEPVGVAVDNSMSVSAGDVYVVNANVVDEFEASGKFVCEITGAAGSASAPAGECDRGDASRAGVPGGSFVGLTAIAVDPTNGDLYVVERESGVVDRFGPEGKFEHQVTGLSEPIGVAVGGGPVSDEVYISEVSPAEVKQFDPVTETLSTFATVPVESPKGVAVDSSSGPSAGDVYVVDRESNAVDKFNASGEYQSQISQTPQGPFHGAVHRVSVDPASGDLYVSEDEANGVVYEFDPTGHFLGELRGSETALGSMEPADVAVTASGDVYVADGDNKVVNVFGPGVLVPNVKTGAATNLQGSSATVEGTVNPEEVALSECSFEYETGESGTLSAECEPSAKNVPTSNEEHTVTAKLPKLEPGATYSYRLHAANGNGVARYGNYESFTTLPPPSIESAVAKNVTGGSALLEASIDPNGYPVTSCEFEYGTTTEYGTVLACPQSLGEGTSPVTETLQLTKLEQGKTYHWRVVATNANGTVGVDHTFVYETSGNGLPDHRAYELVTPAHKNGALFGDLYDGGLSVEVANDGSRVIGEAIQCFGNAEACIAVRDHIGTPYSFTRTSTGWQTTAFAPPATRFPAYSVQGYDANTGSALFTFPNEGSIGESFLLRGAEGSLTELGPATASVIGGVHTEDFSHFTWQEKQVFEHAGADGSAPFLVGVRGGLGSPDLISACSTVLGSTEGDHRGAMSADGSVVYFTAISDNRNAGGCSGTVSAPPVNELYARVDGEQEGAHTVPISVRSPGDCTGECATSTPADAEFWGASEDGAKVFFTSTQQLTNEATPGQDNLYEYDFDNPEGHNLIDLSAGEGPVAGGPRVQGVTAISADGSHVYFVAQGVLTHSPDAQGQPAREGQDNLYVFERDSAHPAGSLAFIATLAPSDFYEWGSTKGGLSSDAHLANVTPDGRFLVFRSHARLTADDTSRSGANQVFRYDGDPNPEEEAAHVPRLIRISIGNDGFNDNGNRSTPTPCSENECPENATIVQSEERPRRDPTMSDNGEYVFFQSPVGLTPQALDDAPIGVENENTSDPGITHNTVYAQNVYEWHQGHVYLISDGRDVSKDAGQFGHCGGSFADSAASSVCLLGTDESGGDVFFSTADALVPQDTDTELDYYDARIGGGFPAPAASPPCVGEECHGIPAGTPPAPSAPTATFNGAGNPAPPPPVVKPKTAAQIRAEKLTKALKSCKKDKKKAKRKTCEKQARSKYGPTKTKAKAKKSSHNGRTSR